jgi:uncharacterized protein (UPF0276 family)
MSGPKAPPAPRFPIRLSGIGLGFRSVHFDHIRSRRPDVDWFEVMTDDYIDGGGRPLRRIEELAEQYPIVLHGVALGIGNASPLDRGYVRKVRDLAKRCQAVAVSDHLCWTGTSAARSYDLLPLPYTEGSLRHVVRRIREVQDLLEQPLVLENPSTYLEFSASSMPEQEFVARVADEADCGLLLDVNNVYVNSVNHGFDPVKYLEALPAARVVYMHVSGHTRFDTHIIDSHHGPVTPPVWSLCHHALRLMGPRPTCLDWGEEIPDFETLRCEAQKVHRPSSLPKRFPSPARLRNPDPPRHKPEPRLAELQSWLCGKILRIPLPKAPRLALQEVVEATPSLGAHARLGIYSKSYFYRLLQILEKDYPATRTLLGPAAFKRTVRAYLRRHAAPHASLAFLGCWLPGFLEGRGNRFLAGVARLELVMIELFLAGDGAPRPTRSLRLHPAARLLEFRGPVNAFVTAARRGLVLPRIDSKPTWTLAYRKGDLVYRKELSAEEHDFLSCPGASDQSKRAQQWIAEGRSEGYLYSSIRLTDVGWRATKLKQFSLDLTHSPTLKG